VCSDSPFGPEPARSPANTSSQHARLEACYPGKKRARSYLSIRTGKYLATTYSHKTYRLTTIGAAAFHFRVRNGTGWFHRAVVTRGQFRLSRNWDSEDGQHQLRLLVRFELEPRRWKLSSNWPLSDIHTENFVFSFDLINPLGASYKVLGSQNPLATTSKEIKPNG
jgi:hypothetical protein